MPRHVLLLQLALALELVMVMILVMVLMCSPPVVLQLQLGLFTACLPIFICNIFYCVHFICGLQVVCGTTTHNRGQDKFACGTTKLQGRRAFGH